MSEQLALAFLLIDADARARERRDQHRGRVQAWYDTLPDGEEKAPAQHRSYRSNSSAR